LIRWQWLPPPIQEITYVGGHAAPVVEMAIGIGLLSRRGRTAALIAALAMHVFIAFSIGPLRNDWNNSASAWNLGSMLIVFILFYKEKNAGFVDLIRPARPAIQVIVLFFFGLMPLCSFFGLWDSALSFNVYSGNTTSALIYLDDPAAARLPSDLRRYVHKENPYLDPQQHLNVLPVWRWSDQEFRAGPYPEVRVFRRILAQLCGRVGDVGVAMEIRMRTDWLHETSRTLHYNCQTVAD
jgi:hypothetical protein